MIDSILCYMYPPQLTLHMIRSRNVSLETGTGLPPSSLVINTTPSVEQALALTSPQLNESRGKSRGLVVPYDQRHIPRGKEELAPQTTASDRKPSNEHSSVYVQESLYVSAIPMAVIICK